MVGRRVSKIREQELRPRKVNHRKLTTDAVRKPRPAVRGVEGPTVGGTIQTMSVMQTTAPGLTGAGKDAGLESTWVDMVGHRELNTTNLINKGSGVDNYVAGTEENQIPDWEK